uniref:Uncharacterized protein n=1 Tax=Nelumbo nucifera TaxID=4432 RepID=A0A822Z7K3_NELNU|nr:TPA_asm: hypothetical protein HUJ06_015160 [Nelumbo nucifera]
MEELSKQSYWPGLDRFNPRLFESGLGKIMDDVDSQTRMTSHLGYVWFEGKSRKRKERKKNLYKFGIESACTMVGGIKPLWVWRQDLPKESRVHNLRAEHPAVTWVSLNLESNNDGMQFHKREGNTLH